MHAPARRFRRANGDPRAPPSCRRRRRRLRWGLLEKKPPHPRRQNQGREKFLPQPLPANDVEVLVPYGYAADRNQRQGGVFGQLLTLQESALGFPVDGLRHPLVLVAEPRRPLGRREDRAI